MPVVLHHALSDNKITEARAKRAAAGKNAEAYSLTDGGGLYLDVDHRKRKGDTHIWRALVYVNGRRTKETFGAYPLLSIEDARAKLQASLGMLVKQEAGKQVNPSHVKREANAVAQAAEALRVENERRHQEGETILGSVWDYVEQVHKLRQKKQKGDTTDSFLRILRKDVFDSIGHMPIGDVTKKHIDAISEAILARAGAKSTKGNTSVAATVRDFLKEVFSYAASLDVISAIPVVDSVHNKIERLPKTSHAAITTLTGLGQLVRAITVDPRALARDAFFFALATLQRRETIINAQWDHIKWAEREWHIPRWTLATEAAERARLMAEGIIDADDAAGKPLRIRGAMKGKKTSREKDPLRIPLSRQTMDMLQRMLDEQIADGTLCRFIFPSYDSKDRDIHGMGTNVIGEMLRDGVDAGLFPKHTLHGTRATGRTLILDAVGETFELDGRLFHTAKALEAQIDHKKIARDETHGMVGVYDRHDRLEQRRHLMQVWSDIVEREYHRKPEAALVAASPLAPHQLAALAAAKARKAPAPQLTA